MFLDVLLKICEVENPKTGEGHNKNLKRKNRIKNRLGGSYLERESTHSYLNRECNFSNVFLINKSQLIFIKSPPTKRKESIDMISCESVRVFIGWCF